MDDKDQSVKTGVRQKIHALLVQLYCSIVFLFKNPGRVVPVFLLSVKRLFYGNKYVFVLAAPTHTNIGDHMIAFAMREWCKKYLSDYSYFEYDDSIYKDWSYFNLLKFVIKKRDLLFFMGGGNVGDRYPGLEAFVRHVLRSYPKNKIVMFPQSVNFSSTPEGEYEKEMSATAYDAHPDFTLFTRDETSFILANRMCRRAKVRLCPDIAMFLFCRYMPKQYERNGLFLCLRNDTEKFYSDSQRNRLKDILKLKFEINNGDTGAAQRVTAEMRKLEIEKLLSCFSKSRVTVTDRFHGVIAAVLTGTPCVVLRSADHKIISGIQWFKSLDYVFYAETLDDVPELVEKLMMYTDPTTPDFSHYFDRLFEEIVNG